MMNVMKKVVASVVIGGALLGAAIEPYPSAAPVLLWKNAHLSDLSGYAAWRTARPFMTGPDLKQNMVKKFASTSSKGLGWTVKITSDEETGLAVATLACYPNEFIILVR